MKKIIAIVLCIVLIITSSMIGYLVVSANTEVKIEENIIEKQNEIQKDFKIYGYTIDNPNIILNPYEISPLTALIIFETEQEEEVTIKINGKTEEESIINTFEKSTKHYIPIYGLYPDYDNIITLTSGDITKDYTIKTEPLPQKFPNIIENNTDKNLFITTETYPYALDKDNEIRWYLTKEYSKKINFLPNNHLLLSTDKLTDKRKNTGLIEVDLLGKVHKEYGINTGYYGSYIIEDNSILVLSNNLLEVDMQTGTIIKEIKLNNEYNSISILEEENIVEENKINLNFYNNESNYKIEQGYYFNTNNKTKTANKKIVLINYKNIDKEYEKHNIKLKKEKERLSVSGNFNKEDKVYIILDKFLNKKIYQLNANDNTSIKNIYKEGLNGKYSIYIKINNNLYKTNQYVEF